jgi:hypothetical protein
MDAKSENGDVGGVVDYTAHPPPPPPRPGSSEKPGATAAASSSTLTAAQTAMHKEILEHFQSESYKIPGVEDGELLEAEKFWLVRVSIFSNTFFVGINISNLWVGHVLFVSLMTACYGNDVLLVICVVGSYCL